MFLYQLLLTLNVRGQAYSNHSGGKQVDGCHATEQVLWNVRGQAYSNHSGGKQVDGGHATEQFSGM